MKHAALLTGFLAALLMVAGCSMYHNSGPVSYHFDGSRFFNPGKPMHKGFRAFLRWRFTADPQPWPEFAELPTFDRPPARIAGNELRISFVGHATVLLQTQGLNILTDPVWSGRTSPVQWAGPKRVHPPGIRFDDLPAIDVILISHNHYDHLDLNTVERIWQRDRPRIILPLGNAGILTAKDIEAEAYDWGDKVEISTDVTVYLEPMHHWSARGLFDRNKALWAAFTLTTPGGNIYCVSDSGYGNGDVFRQAKEKFGDFRLALIPIGSYDPRWFMSYGHMNPEEGLLALHDLGMPYMLPIHYGMFQLADTGYAAPLEALKAAMEKHAPPAGRINSIPAGKSWTVPLH